MNRLLLLSLFAGFLATGAAHAQQNATLVNQVVGSSGKTYSLNGWQWSFTVGEAVTATLQGSTRTLTQGFHQPEIAAYVGTADLDLAAWQLRVFPNPTADLLTVRYRDESGRQLIATIYDLLGRVVAAEVPLDDPAGSTLNCAAFQPGVYLLHLREPIRGASATVRFVRL